MWKLFLVVVPNVDAEMEIKMRKTSSLMMAAICAVAIMQVSCKSSVKTSGKTQDTTPVLADTASTLIPTLDAGLDSSSGLSGTIGSGALAGDITAGETSGAYGNIPVHCLNHFNQQRTLLAANLNTFERSITFPPSLQECQFHLNNYMQGPMWNGYNGDVGFPGTGIINQGIGINPQVLPLGHNQIQPILPAPSYPILPNYNQPIVGGCGTGISTGISRGCGTQIHHNVYPAPRAYGSCHTSRPCGVSGCVNCRPGIVGAAAIGVHNTAVGARNIVRGTLRGAGRLLFGGCATCY
jgi:hypothetical protein